MADGIVLPGGMPAAVANRSWVANLRSARLPVCGPVVTAGAHILMVVRSQSRTRGPTSERCESNQRHTAQPRESSASFPSHSFVPLSILGTHNTSKNSTGNSVIQTEVMGTSAPNGSVDGDMNREGSRRVPLMQELTKVIINSLVYRDRQASLQQLEASS